MNNSNKLVTADHLVSGSLLAIWASLFGVALTLLVAYNEKLRKGELKGEPFLDLQTKHRLLLLSKMILFLVIIYFLYVAYTNYQNRDKNNNDEEKDLLLQLISAGLVFVASLITTYVVLKNYGEEDLEISLENPEI